MRPVLALVMALLAGAVAGRATPSWSEGLGPPPATPAPGRVVAVDLVGDGVRILVELDAAPGARVRSSAGHRPPGLAPGARVLVTGSLRRPPPADNPGDFDYRGWCDRRRIAWLTGEPPLLLEAAPAEADAIVRVRAAARERLLAATPAEGGGLLLGLLLGDQGFMAPWIDRAFDATGTGHLLSVSGIHISGVALLAFALGRAAGARAGALRPEIPGALLALPASLIFVALAQFPLAGMRSALMVAFGLVGRLVARRTGGLNALGLSALLVLADDPGLGAEPSFQLSFGAVLALVMFAGDGRGLPALFRASLAASLATLPIQCAHFGTVAPFAPLANLVVVPLASVAVVPLGLAGLILAPVTPVVVELAAHTALALACVTEVLSDASGGLRVPGAWAAPLLSAPLVLWAVAAAFGRRAALAGLPLAVPLALWTWPPDTTCDVIAVGQGDAILLRSGGRAMLVDVGPDPDARAVRDALRHQGVSRLDAVVVTHAHPDHFGGLVALAGEVPIESLYTNGHLATGPAGVRMAAALARLGLAPRPPPAGPFRLGALWLEFFNAPPGTAADAHDTLGGENDASLVLRVDGPGGAVVLPGDLEAAGEARVATELAARGPVAVLKAPHHGSRTSSTPYFLDRIRPAAVVFTVGRANRFAFPRPQVQARYAARGISQWQTDVDGAVRIHFDSAGLTMSAHHRRTAVRLPGRTRSPMP
jgi:competence protein ComEC